MASEKRIRAEIEALREQLKKCDLHTTEALVLKAMTQTLTWVLTCPGPGQASL